MSAVTNIGTHLASATWTQTPERKSKEFALTLDSAPQSDTLFLETENGDNPPIELEKFTAFYPATRMLFKAKAGRRTVSLLRQSARVAAEL